MNKLQVAALSWCHKLPWAGENTPDFSFKVYNSKTSPVTSIVIIDLQPAS